MLLSTSYDMGHREPIFAQKTSKVICHFLQKRVACESFLKGFNVILGVKAAQSFIQYAVLADGILK